MFCAFLDASKAFDRIVHAGLFLKMIKRKVPFLFLTIIMSWYTGLECRVKWEEHFSDWFAVTAGVRQGGVLSPNFYCIYVDDLIGVLKALGIGCHYVGIFAAALFYADDIAILAPSIKAISTLLNACSEYCKYWDICLNPKKSRLMYFGKRTEIRHQIHLNGKPVEWTDSWVYLGVTLNSSKVFNCSVTEQVKKFYRSANGIFRIEGRSNDIVMLRLMEAHCVPILTYGIEIVHINDRDERRQLRVAYNSIFRKLFGYRQYESVTNLQGFLGRPTWEQLVEKRVANFERRIRDLEANDLAHALLF